MLLTFFDSEVRCGVRQCGITYSLSMTNWLDKSAYNDRSTHFLLVIQCTMGSFTKNQIESCHSLSVDNVTWLLIRRKYYSQTVVMRQYVRSILVQCYLPTDIINITDPANQNMLTTNLYFTPLFIGHLVHDYWILFHVQGLEGYLPPDECFTRIYHSIWGYIPPCPPIAI